MAAPIVTSIDPQAGIMQGGTSVVITGSNFAGPGLGVRFGDLPADSFVVTVPGSEITAVAPAVLSVGEADVVVFNDDGQSEVPISARFYYFNPVATPYYVKSNVYFDPLASYVFYGSVVFVQTPLFASDPSGGIPVGAWDVTGNAPAAPAIFGTLNNQPISFRANSVEYMKFEVGTQRLDIEADNFQVNSATLVGINSDQVSIQAVSGIAIGSTSVPEVVIGNDSNPANIVSIQAPNVFLDFIPSATTPDVVYIDTTPGPNLGKLSSGPAPGGGSGWLLDGSNTGAGHTLGLSDANDFAIVSNGNNKIVFNGGTQNIDLFGNPGHFNASGSTIDISSVLGTSISAGSNALDLTASNGPVSIQAQGGAGTVTIDAASTMTLDSSGILLIQGNASGSLVLQNDLTVESTLGTLRLNSGVDTLMQSQSGITQIRCGAPADPGAVPAQSLKVVTAGVIAGAGYQGVTWTAFGGNIQLDSQTGNASLDSVAGSTTVSGQTSVTVTSNAGNVVVQAPTGEVNISAAAGAINALNLAPLVTSDSVYYNAGTGRLTYGASAAVAVAVQVFAAPGAGTYTPTAGMKYCIVEAVGGGGAGGGALGATPNSCGAGGGAGGYCRGIFSAATIGGSQAYVVGAGGLGVSGGNGNSGVATTFGALMTASPGAGGPNDEGAVGGLGGAATGGDVQATGNAGFDSFVTAATPSFGTVFYAGKGGGSYFGGSSAAPRGNVSGFDQNGLPGDAPGAGGSGALGIGGTFTGGDGASGIIIVTEYI